LLPSFSYLTLSMLIFQLILFNFCSVFINDDKVPFLEMDNFQFELIYTLKNKPQPENKNYYNGNVSIVKTETLPHVRIKILLDSIPISYVRYRIFTNTDNQLRSRKIRGIEEIDLDIGFTVDIKERIVAHSYTIIFYDNKKNSVSEIVINFSEGGEFFMNDQLMGKI
jgi:hypothetical protein